MRGFDALPGRQHKHPSCDGLFYLSEYSQTDQVIYLLSRSAELVAMYICALISRSRSGSKCTDPALYAG